MKAPKLSKAYIYRYQPAFLDPPAILSLFLGTDYRLDETLKPY